MGNEKQSPKELLAQIKRLENHIKQLEHPQKIKGNDYFGVLENINVAIALHEIVTDEHNVPIDFVFLAVNPAYEKLTLLTAENVIGKRGRDVIPNLEQKWIDAYGHVAQTGEAKTIIDHSDYLDKYWEVNVFSPEPNQFAVTLADITERINTEKAVKESESRFRNIVTSSPMGIFIYKLDEDERLIFSANNPAANKILGVDCGQFVGKTMQEAFPPLAETELPDRYLKAAKYGESWSTEQVEYADDKIAGAFEVYAFQTEPNVMVAMFMDITQRKKAEYELQQSQEKLDTLFNAMTEMVVLHDMVYDENDEPIDYRIIDCNSAFTDVTGITREMCIDKLASEVYGGGEAPFLQKYANVAQTGQDDSYTTFFEPMDKHFMISVVSPQIGQFATITTDITAIKQFEQMLTNKNNELENYLYVASHDLRTPLVNIQGFSIRLEDLAKSLTEDILALDIDNDKKVEIEQKLKTELPKTLGFIFSGVQKMDKLIKGLLQISRTGRQMMTVQKIDMNKLFKEICDIQQYQIQEISAKINIDKVPECYGDPVLINQLFSNLITNSIKYRDVNRPLIIDISAKVSYNKIIYSIKDNGIGIAERHLERIWNVFFRVNPETSESGEGIGLSLVKRIVDKHKGKVSVKSKEGEGTTILVELYNKSFQV